MSIQDIKANAFTMLAAAALLAGCGATDGARVPSSGGTGVRTAQQEGIGTVLVDMAGKTLYFSDQESDGTIRCVDDCLQFWFPAEDADATAAGISGLDVLRRADDGRNQLTYQGKPLYSFRLDRVAGEARGNKVEDDFGGTHFVWHAVTVAAPASGGADDGGGYGGGGY